MSHDSTERERILAGRGFRREDRTDSWFNRSARKAFTHNAIRDYPQNFWALALKEIPPAGDFYFYFVFEPDSGAGCERNLRQWSLPGLKAVIRTPQQASQPTMTRVMTIDDPEYWAPLSDEEVFERMTSGQAGSPIWLRGEAEIKLRDMKRAAKARAEQTERSATQLFAAPDLSFIRSPELRMIAERDWKECRRALSSEHWKSVIVLAGGILESIVLSQLLRRRKRALGTTAARGAQADPKRWTLGRMIKVAQELGLFGPAIATLPESMKEYRNLAHPGHELREKLIVSKSTAELSFKVLSVIVEEQSGPRLKRRSRQASEGTHVKGQDGK